MEDDELPAPSLEDQPLSASALCADTCNAAAALVDPRAESCDEDVQAKADECYACFLDAGSDMSVVTDYFASCEFDSITSSITSATPSPSLGLSPSSAPNAGAEENKSSSSGLTMGTLVGAILGSTGGTALVAVAIFLSWRLRSRHPIKAPDGPLEKPMLHSDDEARPAVSSSPPQELSAVMPRAAEVSGS